METSWFLWITFFGSLFAGSDSYCTKTSKDSFVPEKHKNWENLDHRSCGFSMKNRIIGGEFTHLGQFPWLARVGTKGRIGMNGRPRLLFPCGGAILNSHYILSAAHCFMDAHKLPTFVRLGEFNTRTVVDCSNEYCAPPLQDIDILTYYSPRQFDPKLMENDLALILLKNPIQFYEYVHPICLPPYSITTSNLTGKFADVAGWGLTDIYTRTTATVLQVVSLKIIDNSWCNIYKEHTRFPFNIICAGGEEGHDSCSGDSGGPLMLPEEEGGTVKYYIVGVVSYGPEACGESNAPGVYTYVAQYMNWILDHIDKK